MHASDISSQINIDWVIEKYKVKVDNKQYNKIEREIRDMEMQFSLEQRWTKFCHDLNINIQTSDHWLSLIKQKYSELQRHYHTLKHLETMFCYFDVWKSKLNKPDDVLLAIYFHDIVYDPRCSDNEERSIQLFREFCDENLHQIKEEDKEHVIYLIRTTITHTTDDREDDRTGNREDDREGRTDDREDDIADDMENYRTNDMGNDRTVDRKDDICYFLDFDLAILASNGEEYDEYSNNIRKEYHHFEEQTFNIKRRAVLEDFLERRHIFATKIFQDLYEGKARENIKREIHLLKVW